MEADMQRDYGIDLNDAVQHDRITWRRFRVLVEGLGSDSAWARFLADTSKRSLVDVGTEGRVR